MRGKRQREWVRSRRMASVNNKGRPFGAHHNPPLCTRSHQIGALLLVCTTFFLTRALDRLLVPSSHNPFDGFRQPHYAVQSNDDGSISWPERGYGSHLSLKIYVYDETEIQGLKALMYGRDGKITAAACLKGQWGTQVFFWLFLLYFYIYEIVLFSLYWDYFLFSACKLHYVHCINAYWLNFDVNFPGYSDNLSCAYYLWMFFVYHFDVMLCLALIGHRLHNLTWTLYKRLISHVTFNI